MWSNATLWTSIQVALVPGVLVFEFFAECRSEHSQAYNGTAKGWDADDVSFRTLDCASRAAARLFQLVTRGIDDFFVRWYVLTGSLKNDITAI